MFDLSLCPIWCVQYGGNLHNVPQQGGVGPPPTFLTKKAKTQFVLCVIIATSQIFQIKSHWHITNISQLSIVHIWYIMCLNIQKIFCQFFYVFFCQIYHLVKNFPAPHCREIFSWSNIEFQQSPLFTAVGGLGGWAEAQEIKGFWCIQHQHFSQTGLNSASCRNSIRFLYKKRCVHYFDFQLYTPIAFVFLIIFLWLFG